MDTHSDENLKKKSKTYQKMAARNAIRHYENGISATSEI